VFHDPFGTEQKKGTLPFGVRKIRRFSQKFQNCLIAAMPFAKRIEEDEPTCTLPVSMTPIVISNNFQTFSSAWPTIVADRTINVRNNLAQAVKGTVESSIS